MRRHRHVKTIQTPQSLLHSAAAVDTETTGPRSLAPAVPRKVSALKTFQNLHRHLQPVAGRDAAPAGPHCEGTRLAVTHAGDLLAGGQAAVRRPLPQIRQIGNRSLGVKRTTTSSELMSQAGHLLAGGRAAVRGPRSCERGGRQAAGVHAHQDEGAAAAACTVCPRGGGCNSCTTYLALFAAAPSFEFSALFQLALGSQDCMSGTDLPVDLHSCRKAWAAWCSWRPHRCRGRRLSSDHRF